MFIHIRYKNESNASAIWTLFPCILCIEVKEHVKYCMASRYFALQYICPTLASIKVYFNSVSRFKIALGSTSPSHYLISPFLRTTAQQKNTIFHLIYVLWANNSSYTDGLIWIYSFLFNFRVIPKVAYIHHITFLVADSAKHSNDEREKRRTLLYISKYM